MNNPELLKCPCCGNLPSYYRQRIYLKDVGGYWCHCTRYACDFPYAVMANNEVDVIKAWNNAVLKYKESKNE